MSEPLLLSPKEALPIIEDLLKSGASCPILVTGNSMLPFLHHEKETVIVSPVTSPLKRDDIIFYNRGTQITEKDGVRTEAPIVVLHRIYKLTDYGCITLGDAQTKKEPVKTAQILGVVTQVQKNGKTHSVNNIFYRFGVMVWRWLLPLRPYLLRLFR